MVNSDIIIKGGTIKMETLKDEAISAISKLPESATIDDIMDALSVLDIPACE